MATNALFLTRCFLSTFMKECSDEELLQIFNVPHHNEMIITPHNYNRSWFYFIILLVATLIKTYGETSFLLIETVVDVIVSHSSQQFTNKLCMEAMGVLLTLFSRLLQRVSSNLFHSFVGRFRVCCFPCFSLLFPIFPLGLILYLFRNAFS